MDAVTWFFVDDKFGESRKVRSIPRSQRMAAVGLWTMAGQWSAGQLTDGNVPTYMVEELGGNRRLAEALVACGLWEPVTDGYVFHDWTDWQKTRSQVETERSKARERMAKLRGSSPDVRANRDRTSGEVRDPLPYPTQPQVLTEPETTTSSEDVRPEVTELCALLADRIESNGSKRPTITKAWLTDCRLMLDRDNRTPNDVRGAINWSQTHHFWKTNILSMGKLRQQFDRLRMQAEQERQPGRSARQNDTDDFFDRAMARAQQADADDERLALG